MKYFDLHCDTALECYKQNKEFYKNDLSVSGEIGESFDNWHQVFAIFINDNEKEPFKLYKNVLNDFKYKLKNAPNNLTAYFSCEGGSVLENDIDRLYILKQDKIEILTLTWNGENNIAGGVESQKGLTEFGRKVIDKMNELKIICDLSHINEKSFYKAAERADKIIATHSNCYNICKHKRNLKAEQIKIIAEKKGIMGICFYPMFLGGDVYEKIYENIFYLCDKGYEDIISIGSDFDGGDMAKKLDKITKVPDLYMYLQERGLKNELLSKIFYENAYKYIANS